MTKQTAMDRYRAKKLGMTKPLPELDKGYMRPWMDGWEKPDWYDAWKARKDKPAKPYEPYYEQRPTLKEELDLQLQEESSDSDFYGVSSDIF